MMPRPKKKDNTANSRTTSRIEQARSIDARL